MAEPIYMLVGARIRMVMEAVDIPQGELAKRLKLTRTSVTNIIAGRQRLQLHTVTAIAKALGTTEKHLMRGLWW